MQIEFAKLHSKLAKLYYVGSIDRQGIVKH